MRRFWIIPALLLAGCSASQNSASMAKAEDGSVPAERSMDLASQSEPAPAAAQAVMANRQVIREAQVRLRVARIEDAERSANTLVARVGGFVETVESSDLDSERPLLTLTARVPVDRFDKVMREIEGLGVRLSKSIRSQDVTGTVIDLDARVRSLAAKETSLRRMLASAREVNQIITIEDQLSQVRSQIESISGQRKALAGQAAFSTIQVQFEQAAAGAGAPKDPGWLAQTWNEATNTLGNMLRSVVVFLVWAAVLSPIWLLAIWTIRRAVRRRAPAAYSKEGPPRGGPF